MGLLKTKIVTGFAVKGLLALACLASLGACSDKKDKADSRYRYQEATGLNSKTGQSLSSGEMCGELETDEVGKSTIATFRFLENGVLIRRTRVLSDESSFPVASETRGSWAYLNDQLLLTENGITARHNIETFLRDSDQAQCFRITSGETHPEFCGCDVR